MPELTDDEIMARSREIQQARNKAYADEYARKYRETMEKASTELRRTLAEIIPTDTGEISIQQAEYVVMAVQEYIDATT